MGEAEFSDKNHPEGFRKIKIQLVAAGEEMATSGRHIVNPYVEWRPVIYGSDTSKDKTDFTLVGNFLDEAGNALWLSERFDRERIIADLDKKWKSRKLSFDFSGKKKKEPFELD